MRIWQKNYKIVKNTIKFCNKLYKKKSAIWYDLLINFSVYL